MAKCSVASFIIKIMLSVPRLDIPLGTGIGIVSKTLTIGLHKVLIQILLRIFGPI
jgi:hypothetical protein